MKRKYELSFYIDAKTNHLHLGDVMGNGKIDTTMTSVKKPVALTLEKMGIETEPWQVLFDHWYEVETLNGISIFNLIIDLILTHANNVLPYNAQALLPHNLTAPNIDNQPVGMIINIKTGSICFITKAEAINCGLAPYEFKILFENSGYVSNKEGPNMLQGFITCVAELSKHPKYMKCLEHVFQRIYAFTLELSKGAANESQGQLAVF